MSGVAMQKTSHPYVPPSGAKPPGKGLKPSAIILIVIGAILLVVAGAFAVKETAARREARRAADRKMLETLDEAQNDLRKQMESDGSITDTRGMLKKMQAGFESAGASMTGDEAKVARASSRLFQAIQDASVGMERLAKQLEEEEVFNAGKVKDRDRLKKIRRLGNELIVESDSMLKLVLTSDVLFRKILQEAGVGEATSRGVIEGMRKTMHLQEPLQRRIRGADRKIGQDMIAFADLLESEWGKWACDADGEVTFQNDAAAEKFNKIIEGVQNAAADQASAQKALVETMGKRR